MCAGCAERSASDDMHLYTDRVAIITGTNADAEPAPKPLLVTTLSIHTGKVMLNTDLGDCARLSDRSCGCVFGELGLNLRVSDIGSQQRLTVEGMTVPIAALDALLGQLIEEMGGQPDSHQFWAVQKEGGLERLILALSPSLGLVDEENFLEALYKRMLAGGAGLELAARFWKQVGTVEIIREHPRQSRGAKISPMRRAEGASRANTLST